jgi:hypothetical protein
MNRAMLPEVEKMTIGAFSANDAILVHREQVFVQQRLDGLAQASPATYRALVQAANRVLNIGMAPGDRLFKRASDETRRTLGRSIDFARQGDRELLGRTLAADFKSANCTANRAYGPCQ